MKLLALFVIFSLLLACAGAASEQDANFLELKAGWNLVSSPVKEGIPNEKIAENCKIKSGPWIWDTRIKDYVKTNKGVEPYIGTWIKVQSDCKIFYDDNKIQEMVSLPLKKSWNLISGVGDVSRFGGCIIKSGPWYYNTTKKNYLRASFFTPERGYWVKVAKDCLLQEKPPE